MWIEDFREAHGLERYEFARRVRMLGAKKRPKRPIDCSEKLIWILESRRNAVTHPKIANLIAEACGATPKQRDRIVHAKHRGTWTGDGVPKILDMNVLRAVKPMAEDAVKADAAEENPWRNRPAVLNQAIKLKRSGKEVVRIDMDGNITGRYKSKCVAAAENLIALDMVLRRTRREIVEEFKSTGYSFRLAEEWDRMSAEARRADLERVRKTPNKRWRNRKKRKEERESAGSL